MPYTITREKTGLYKQFSGFVSADEFLQSIFETQADPDYEFLSYSIHDFLRVQGHSVLPTQVKIAAAYSLGAEFTNARLRFAVLTVDAEIRDLLRDFCALTHRPCEVFTSIEDARIWLGQA